MMVGFIFGKVINMHLALVLDEIMVLYLVTEVEKLMRF